MYDDPVEPDAAYNTGTHPLDFDMNSLGDEPALETIDKRPGQPAPFAPDIDHDDDGEECHDEPEAETAELALAADGRAVYVTLKWIVTHVFTMS